MFKQFKALLWLRWEIIAANKTLLVQLFLPVAMVLLYQFMFSKMPSDQSSDMIMATMPSIILGFIGTTITYLIAEENEKHNLTSLQLAGMGSLEYLLANLTLPLVIELVYLIALPLYLGVSLSSLGLTYAVVNLLTALVALGLFIFIGIICKTQTQATILSLPFMLVVAFLPFFAMMDNSLKKVIDFTFMGTMTNYLRDRKHYQLMDKSLIFLLLWLVLTGALLFWGLRHHQLQSEKKA